MCACIALWLLSRSWQRCLTAARELSPQMYTTLKLAVLLTPTLAAQLVGRCLSVARELAEGKFEGRLLVSCCGCCGTLGTLALWLCGQQCAAARLAGHPNPQ